ncbi:MAG: hypothetical protein H6502_03480 [Candidatus Woesearchaeota archaeon]|nr:MAG: hypothetical protein H6502_03480 [Candidatus Woesearchaeota archaeon]
MDYDGWGKFSDTCENYVFTEASSRECFNSTFYSFLDEQNIIRSKIKVPSLVIINTVLTSKYVDAFVVEGTEACVPSLAITADGSRYATGACLG